MTILPLHRIRSKVPTEHAQGRDALFQKERLRADYFRRLKDRTELHHFREKLALNVQLSDAKNELERVEGAIAHHTRPLRLAHLERARGKLRAQLGLPEA